MNKNIIDKILKYSAITCLFAVLLVPMVVSPSILFLYITGKAYAFRIIVEIAFALWLILALRDPSYMPCFSRRSWLLWAATAFTVIIGIADVLGVEPLRSLSSNYERMEGFVFVAHLFMYFIAASSVMGQGDISVRRKFWGWFANASLLVSLIVGIHGLQQITAGNNSMRIDSYLGNSTYLGIYALIHIFVALFLWMQALYQARSVDKTWHTPSIIRLVGYAVVAFFNLYIMYHTGTRGSLVGLAAGLGFIALMLAIFEKKHRAIRGAGISILAIIVVAVALLGSFKNTDFVKNNNLLARFSELATFDFRGVLENQGHARVVLWKMAYKGFKEHPLLGWGQDNFIYVFGKYYDPQMYSQESWFDRTHNVIFDWAISAGILGLLAYLSLYTAALYYIWRSRLSIGGKSVLTGLFIAHFVHNLFVFDNLSSYILFFSALAFVQAMTVSNATTGGHNGKLSETYTTLISYAATPAIVIALIAGIYFVNVRGIQAGQTLIMAMKQAQTGGQLSSGKSANLPLSEKYFDSSLSLFEKSLAYGAYVSREEARTQIISYATGVITSPNLSTELKNKWLAFVLKNIDGQIADAPRDVRSYYFPGTFFTQFRQFEKARTYLEQAIAISPAKQQIQSALGYVYLNTNQTDKGIALYKVAYETQPGSESAATAYASALIFAGKEDVAYSTFSATSSVMTSDDIANIYQSLKQYNKAIAVYRLRASASPTDPALNAQSAIHIANIYYKAGNTSAAISVIADFVVRFPQFKKDADVIIGKLRAGTNPFE